MIRLERRNEARCGAQPLAPISAGVERNELHSLFSINARCFYYYLADARYSGRLLSCRPFVVSLPREQSPPRRGKKKKRKKTKRKRKTRYKRAECVLVLVSYRPAAASMFVIKRVNALGRLISIPCNRYEIDARSYFFSYVIALRRIVRSL